MRDVSGIDSARFEMISEGVLTDTEGLVKIDIHQAAIALCDEAIGEIYLRQVELRREDQEERLR